MRFWIKPIIYFWNLFDSAQTGILIKLLSCLILLFPFLLLIISLRCSTLPILVRFVEELDWKLLFLTHQIGFLPLQFTILALSEGLRLKVPSPENSNGFDFNCVGGLECLISLIRALDMGSCLSSSSGGTSRRSRVPPGPPSRRRKSSNSKRRSTSSSFDHNGEEAPLLHRIPGRMFLNGSTDHASLFSQQGKKGPNQDAMIVWEVRFCSCCQSLGFFACSCLEWIFVEHLAHL